VILPDVNVLVHAFLVDSPRHRPYRSWLESVAAGSEELALHDAVLSGVVRVVTHPRIVDPPAPTAAALGFVEFLRGLTIARPVTAGSGTWEALTAWAARDLQLRGNLVPDALLAALGVAHGCRVATADRGYARFPGVRFFDPADPRA
jgi:uncharacterized protein